MEVDQTDETFPFYVAKLYSSRLGSIFDTGSNVIPFPFLKYLAGLVLPAFIYQTYLSVEIIQCLYTSSLQEKLFGIGKYV